MKKIKIIIKNKQPQYLIKIFKLIHKSKNQREFNQCSNKIFMLQIYKHNQFINNFSKLCGAAN